MVNLYKCEVILFLLGRLVFVIFGYEVGCLGGFGLVFDNLERVKRIDG